ncbi:teichoic acid ABC transporter permease, partial [Staphylococcus aureus]|nr:teichoic acid ABC transporter permease [Staphylococcus aureus]
YFIAESYRAAILYHEWYFMDHWKLMLYNFGIVAIFFAIGAYLHMKYRDQFADFL